jgi:hypothetical protein
MVMIRIRAMLVALSVLGLSGCVVAPYYPAQSGIYGPYGAPVAVANVPPPAPYPEVIPAIPYAGAAWISGYWGWNGGRHRWVSGYYSQPRPGYHWTPHRWQPVGGRWQLHGGAWGRRH